jgi:hypothetical protein
MTPPEYAETLQPLGTGEAGVEIPREEGRHLRAVPPRRRRQPRIGLWVGSIATAGSLFLLVAFNVFMVQGQFELDTIAKQRVIEQRQYELLRDKVANLSAPATIVAKARAQGMVDAPNGPTYVDAPPAAPARTHGDRTSNTLKQTYSETKAALDGP